MTATPTAPASPAGAVVSPGRRAFAFGLVLATLLLIFMGAQVKSHEAGLAVHDWPLSYGQLWPPMVGGTFYEHWHRTVATGVGLLAIVLALWTARREPRAWVRRLAWAGLLAVVLQGLLGGLTVKGLLPPSVSMTHGTLAQLVLCLLAWLAYGLSREWAAADRGQPQAAGGRVDHRRAGDVGAGDVRADDVRADDARADDVRANDSGAGEHADVRSALAAAVAALLAVFTQLVLGAWTRHSEAGLAVPFFPISAEGAWLPAQVDGRVAIHMAHRTFALVAALLVWRAVLRGGRASPRLWNHGALLAGLLVAQLVLGALVVWSARHPVVTSLHVTNGAAVLLLTWLLVLRCWRLGRPAPAAVCSRPASAAASCPSPISAATSEAPQAALPARDLAPAPARSAS